MKNTIGGKGHKKARKRVETRVIPFRDDLEGTDYAYVLDKLGGMHLRVFCYNDRSERIGSIRGSMYKRVWIEKDDIVLVSVRDFQQDKCDIIYKYTNDEIKTLVKSEELEEKYASIANKEIIVYGNDDDEVLVSFEGAEINIDEI